MAALTAAAASAAAAAAAAVALVKATDVASAEAAAGAVALDSGSDGGADARGNDGADDGESASSEAAARELFASAGVAAAVAAVAAAAAAASFRILSVTKAVDVRSSSRSDDDRCTAPTIRLNRPTPLAPPPLTLPPLPPLAAAAKARARALLRGDSGVVAAAMSNTGAAVAVDDVTRRGCTSGDNEGNADDAVSKRVRGGLLHAAARCA